MGIEFQERVSPWREKCLLDHILNDKSGSTVSGREKEREAPRWEDALD